MAWHLTAEAEEDIIALFIEGHHWFGLIQAERYHDQLEQTFEFLATHPKAAPLRDEWTPAIHVHPYESHVILYRVDASGDIQIIRVRHGHEDWLRTQ